jgi:hypothetical protein
MVLPMKKPAVLIVLSCTLLAPQCIGQQGGPGGAPFPALGDRDSVTAATACSLENAAVPIVVMAPPAPLPPPPLPPPAPARPVMHEYRWPDPAPRKAAAPAFLLVLTDSAVRLAVAAWQQDDEVHFLTPEGTSGVARLDAIDRDATRRLNADRGLTLSLQETGSSR